MSMSTVLDGPTDALERKPEREQPVKMWPSALSEKATTRPGGSNQLFCAVIEGISRGQGGRYLFSRVLDEDWEMSE